MSSNANCISRDSNSTTANKSDPWKEAFKQGMLALGDKDPQKALACFELAASHDATQPDIFALLGLTLTDLGRYDEAAKYLSTCLALDSRHHDGLINRGLLEMRQSHWLKAIEAFNETLKVNPLSFAALRNQGTCYAHLRRYSEAIRCLQEALRVYPGYTGADIDLGTVFAMAGRILEARAHFARVARENPQNKEARTALRELEAIIGKQAERVAIP